MHFRQITPVVEDMRSPEISYVLKSHQVYFRSFHSRESAAQGLSVGAARPRKHPLPSGLVGGPEVP